MRYDEVYCKTKSYFGAEPEPLLKHHRHLLDKSHRILDIGAGQGRHALFLAREGFKVDAIDSSKVAIETVSAMAAKENLDIRTYQSSFETFEPETDFFGSDLDRILESGREPVSDAVIVGAKNETVVSLEAENRLVEVVCHRGSFFLDWRDDFFVHRARLDGRLTRIFSQNSCAFDCQGNRRGTDDFSAIAKDGVRNLLIHLDEDSDFSVRRKKLVRLSKKRASKPEKNDQKQKPSGLNFLRDQHVNLL